MQKAQMLRLPRRRNSLVTVDNPIDSGHKQRGAARIASSGVPNLTQMSQAELGTEAARAVVVLPHLALITLRVSGRLPQFPCLRCAHSMSAT